MGLGIARTLIHTGYHVIAIARHVSEPLAKAIRQADAAERGSLHFQPFDLAYSPQIPHLVKTMRKGFGPIYGLVNNAALGTTGVLATMHDAQIARLVQMNTVSLIIITKYVIRSMMVDGGGRIVNIGSIAGAARDRSRARSVRSASRSTPSRPALSIRR